MQHIKQHSLAVFFALASVCANADYILIPYNANMKATAQTVSYANRFPDRAIDGSGLDVDGVCHTQNPADNNMWMGQSSSQAYPQWFRVDLGEEHDLGAVKIWNFNFNNGTAYVNRGIKDIDIYIAPDTDNTAVTGASPNLSNAAWSLVYSGQVPQASGRADDAGAPLIEWTKTRARWVGINIKSIWGGGYGGISEIRFYAADIPIVVSLDAIDVSSTTTLGFNGTLETESAANLVACYGAVNGGRNFNAWDATTVFPAHGTGDFAETLSNIPANGGYYFALAATNSAVAWAAQNPLVFIAGPVSVEAPADFYENQYAPGFLTFRRPTVSTNVPFAVTYQISGTALPGVHYQAFSGTVAFDVGVAEVKQQVMPIDNNSTIDRTVAIALDPGNYLANANTTAVFTILGKAGIGETVTWSGDAGDLHWHTPANWNPARIPRATDDILFTAAGLNNGAVITLAQDAQVNSITLDSTASFTIGTTNNQYIAFSALTNNAGNSLIIAARCRVTADTSNISDWVLNSGLRINGGIASAAGVTVRKTGEGTLNLNSAISTAFLGAWEIAAGPVIVNQEDGMRGNVILGGSDASASLSASLSKGFTGNMNVTILTNGLFSCGNQDNGRIRSIHVMEGGRANLTTVYFYSYFASLTGGRIDGGQFFNGGHTQALRSYASATPAVFNCGFNFSTYFDAAISVEDGPAIIDLTTTKNFSVASSSSTINRSGAGVLRMTGASNGLHYKTFAFNSGVTLLDNASGSATGSSAATVAPGATLGGIGFIGGINDNSNLTLNDGSASNYAILAPGTIDEITGDHVIGTLTVGTATQTNNVAFNNYSRLRVNLDNAGNNDMLDVCGAVSISATGTVLEINTPPDEKYGTYTLIRASNGIAGQFTLATAHDTDASGYLRYTPTELLYTVPWRASLFLLR